VGWRARTGGIWLDLSPPRARGQMQIATQAKASEWPAAMTMF
jgi:hypothetical protein